MSRTEGIIIPFPHGEEQRNQEKLVSSQNWDIDEIINTLDVSPFVVRGPGKRVVGCRMVLHRLPHVSVEGIYFPYVDLVPPFRTVTCADATQTLSITLRNVREIEHDDLVMQITADSGSNSFTMLVDPLRGFGAYGMVNSNVMNIPTELNKERFEDSIFQLGDSFLKKFS